MESYNLEEEKKVHPYQYYGKVFEEEHGNTKFLMRSALQYVIDDYDEYLASVEQSHYEELNYNEVVDFSMSEGETALDLTWMNKDDVFNLRNSEQYRTLDMIIVNIDNLGFSHLPSISSNSDNHINLKISALNSQLSFIQQIKAFKNFTLNTGVNTITLVGFNKAVEAIISLYAKKAGIMINADELVEEIQRHR